MDPLDLLNGLPGSIDLIARATALLSLTALLAWAFRTRAATTRHHLWTLTFVLLIALPFASYWLPTLELPILPNPAPAPEATASLPAASAPADLNPAAPGGWRGPSLLWLTWAAGTLVALASLAAGWHRFTTWVREGTAIDDLTWRETVAQLKGQLGIRRGVRLIESPQVHTAMVGGLLQPVVLLPTSARCWSEERRVAVLTHELIHVRRLDPLRQLLASAALALYWFHPLSWLAKRWAVEAREQACDEGVLRQGAQPSAYAAHLLQLASGPTTANAAALPLIQSSQLEKRIKAVLAPRRPGHNPGVATLLIALLFVCGIATAVVEPISPLDAHTRACKYKNPVPD